MEWMTDARQARAGDETAQARLAEYLTPFVHGIALAHAPHHVANALVPRILAEAERGLSTVTDEQHTGMHYASVARRLSRAAAADQPHEVRGATPQVTEARQVLARLRALPESTREHLLLRLVEGVPGPEMAQVLHVVEGELKADLERGMAEAARALDQPLPTAGDTYLWELVGTPQPLVAKLEMLFPVLRYDGATPEASDSPLSTNASTHLSLGQVGDARGRTIAAAPQSSFPNDDETTSALVEAVHEPGPTETIEETRSASDLPPQANPFEPAARTVAATDLPVAAQGVVPVMPSGPPSRSSAKLAPPHSTPSRPPVNEPSRSMSQRLTGYAEPEEAKAKVPPALARMRARALPEPEEPTDPGAAALIEDTRVSLEPRAPSVEAQLGEASEPEPTRVQPMPAVPSRPVPPLTPRSLLEGSTPFVLAALLVVAAAVAGWAGLFTNEAHMKKAWTLVPVVVASQDLNEGDQLVLESLAVRQLPDSMVSSASFVKEDSVTYVLGQRLIAPMQEGDPLCWTHLSNLEHSRRLSVQKRGRAYTIPTSVLASVGRHLKPGDRVDVVATLERPISKSVKRLDHGKTVAVHTDETEQVAVTLLQDIVVLATGKVLPTTRTSSLDARTLAYSNVSLLVLPEEAEQLALAQKLGRLTLTLRTEDDHELLDPVRREWTNLSTLLTGDRTHKLHKRREEVIRLIRGTGKN